ncbi:hypothetical protein FXN61_39605 [Lentzea sp. PSKA42]|uniref:Wadjet protein JetD C-terminal domain-containing protein n=1 Tax=Lentzea indica TaxID=2604800 RepID=A0ABX1FTZ6_9PSEU|nr:Wadjet anti-phage system protein JetD domain-containing protein [Lentzea indica]NKE62514.1 hypothetical protein [Lentzea indica]
MRRPDEIIASLRGRFSDSYADWARGGGTWPMRISLRPPAPSERTAHPVRCHEWAADWATYTGPGHVERANLRFPTGTHPMPKTLVLSRPGDVARAHPDDQATWLRCGRRLTELENSFPRAKFHRLVRRITQLDDADYARLVHAANWLTINPTSGLFLRQLPIEGVHTKWLAAHATLVLALLGDESVDESTDEVPLSRKRALHDRLGLCVVPELVQVTVLDPALRAQFAGMRHFAATVEDLNRWPQHPTQVLILENKETAFAITDDYERTVVLHGHGAHVDQYARITWVRQAERVIYWGDIDLPGLQFVSDLRGMGIPAHTVFTDIDTLHHFRRLAVEGAPPQRTATPPHLTTAERELYEHLTAYSAKHGTGLLLEQERLPWEDVYPMLRNFLLERVTTLESAPVLSGVLDTFRK